MKIAIDKLVLILVQSLRTKLEDKVEYSYKEQGKCQTTSAVTEAQSRNSPSSSRLISFSPILITRLVTLVVVVVPLVVGGMLLLLVGIMAKMQEQVQELHGMIRGDGRNARS